MYHLLRLYFTDKRSIILGSVCSQEYVAKSDCFILYIFSRGVCHKAFGVGWSLLRYSSKFRTGQSGKPSLTSYSIPSPEVFHYDSCLPFLRTGRQIVFLVHLYIFRPSCFLCTTCKLKHQVKPNLLHKTCWRCYVKLPIKMLQILLFNFLVMISVTFATAFKLFCNVVPRNICITGRFVIIMSTFMTSEKYRCSPYLNDLNAFSLCKSPFCFLAPAIKSLQNMTKLNFCQVVPAVR